MSLWLLGGHDPTHGAGLYRDLVTARAVAPGETRCFAVTACTRQGHGRPAQAWPVPAERLRARLSRWPAPRAIKVGLVPDALTSTVAQLLRGRAVPIVVDPVLRASDGGHLGASGGGLAALLGIATLITPNRPEAHALLGEATRGGQSLARALAERFPAAAVLLKDGHGDDAARVVDWLVYQGHATPLERPRIPGPDPRGTGCALASAIAARLAAGDHLVHAVRQGVRWLDGQRRACMPGPDGRAHLPDHPGSPRSSRASRPR